MAEIKQFQINFLTHAGEVLMVFPEPFKFLSLSPVMARDIAAQLVKMADTLDSP